MRLTGSHRLRTVLLVGAALASLIVLTTAGLGTAQSDSTFETATQQTPSNNTTVQHERPSEASGSGDSKQVSQWLERRLASQIQGSAINISQGQYEQARGALGDDYSSRLEQYVDVAGETGTDSEERVETFQDAQQTQRAYANATQEYRETYQRYEQARTEGNTTAAREAARELETLSGRVQRLNESLQRDYVTITNQTDVDTGAAQRSVQTTTANISTQQATVRGQTFVETRLTVRTNESTVAFDDPMSISGQVKTTNGTALENVSGHIIVANRTYRITTDSDGRFQISYRPVSLSVNATSAPVRFLPANTSAYLGSTATVPVAVIQVRPHIEIASGRTSGGYGDSLGTTVVATVDGRPVPSLPLTARLGETVVAARTSDAGRVTLSPQVPADISAGKHSLDIAHERTATAVGPNVATRTITVSETVTSLTISTSKEGTRHVQGRLTTAAGAGVGEQSVHLTVGETDRVVETNATGWYRLSVGDVSALDTADNATVGVTARFRGTGTNLQSSQARTDFVIQDADTGDSDTQPVLILGGLAFGLLIVAGVIGWSRWESDSASSASGSLPEQTLATDNTNPEEKSRQWLERARSALAAADNERAIITAYGAVRRHLEQEASVEPTLTHREFLATAEATLPPAEHAALSTVSTAYESVVFQGVVTGTAATESVEAAAELLPEPPESLD